MTVKHYKLVALLLLAIITSNSYAGSRFSEGTRQIHLDFHTSEAIEGIGKKFDKKQFQAALKAGHVNSINIFAKGHHGWCYYPSKVGEQHPNLEFDLLKAQIEACKEIGVKVQAYVTVGWSAKDSREHPEWILWDEIGKAPKTFEEMKAEDPSKDFGWHWDNLSPEGPYREHLVKLTEELCKNYDLDGFWFDIIPVWNINYNPMAIADMKAKGVDPQDKAAVRQYHSDKMNDFMGEIRSTIDRLMPDGSLFFNWSTHMYGIDAFNQRFYRHNTKNDLEDLPTTWGGYDILPLRAKLYANEGKPLVGMSGKFHKAWGEFGGYKHKDAILYEAAAMFAFGAYANFGDQLHPNGKMSMATYENIGHAFKYIEKIEEYGTKVNHAANLAVWMVGNGSQNDGVNKMLLENQVNFVVANTLKDWSPLKTLIIPGYYDFSKSEVEKINAFTKRGGKLVLLYDAGMNKDKTKFLFEGIGTVQGKSKYSIDYTYVKDEVAQNGLVQAPFLNYDPAMMIAPKATKVLAHIQEPLFNRTYEHYTSHANTPYKDEFASYPAAFEFSNGIYSALNLGNTYNRHGSRVHKDLFNNLLRYIHPVSYATAEMPSAGRLNVLQQKEDNRYIIHLLYATPHQRGAAKVIEDLVPLYKTRVVLNLPKKIKNLKWIPENKDLDFKETPAGIEVIVPYFQAHTAIVAEY